MPQSPLVERVLGELRILRKDSAGVRVETLARAVTICELLGNGDPYLAYTRLQHALLDASLDRTIRAAAASLGFASDGRTHLDRLVEGGDDLHLEQRQVRRLSDQGLESVARLISSNWVVEAVPELTVVVARTASSFELGLLTSRPLLVEMTPPSTVVLVGDVRLSQELLWTYEEVEGRELGALRRSLIVQSVNAETSAVVIWQGELWPKFNVTASGPHRDLGLETLGNKLMLRLSM